MRYLLAYLRLMRPANIITAIADILLGFAATGSISRVYVEGHTVYRLENEGALLWLILATVGLYGGGVVLNDVFDYELDKKERPERALPSGEASLPIAMALGLLLLVAGILAASRVSFTAEFLAILIAALAVCYDAWGKHQDWLGPVNMGLCRGLNVLLGVSLAPSMLGSVWFLAIIPLIYIAAITLISRGEVQGGDKKALQAAFAMYVLVFILILSFELRLGYQLYQSLPFLALFAYLIFPPLIKAYKDLEAKEVFKAVKAGVLALIVMDASIATGFAGWEYGLVVLALLPVSLALAKIFAVS